eukprot:IDg8582t1
MTPTPKEIETTLCHGVRVRRFEYKSDALAGTTTRFHVVHAVDAARAPVLYYLSGLTCTDENCVQKGGVAAGVAEHGLAVVLPDTSPRGAGAPDEDESYDFGTGASFYVDATREGFEAYQMETFITKELPTAVAAALGDAVDVSNAGVFGHSMGGHGALTLALRNKGLYRSVSAFAPITNPSVSAWGTRALSGYLGPDGDLAAHDATELVRGGGKLPAGTLIDQGMKDGFLEKELRTPQFKQTCDAHGVDVQLNMRDGYGHGYFFVCTFMADHIRHHASALLAPNRRLERALYRNTVVPFRSGSANSNALAVSAADTRDALCIPATLCLIVFSQIPGRLPISVFLFHNSIAFTLSIIFARILPSLFFVPLIPTHALPLAAHVRLPANCTRNPPVCPALVLTMAAVATADGGDAKGFEYFVEIVNAFRDAAKSADGDDMSALKVDSFLNAMTMFLRIFDAFANPFFANVVKKDVQGNIKKLRAAAEKCKSETLGSVLESELTDKAL